MPYRVELASTGRAGCAAPHCDDKIQKDELRCGVIVTVHDHSSWKWRHWDCNTNLTLHHILDSLNMTKADVVEKGGLSKLDGFDELPEKEQSRIIETFSNLDEKREEGQDHELTTKNSHKEKSNKKSDITSNDYQSTIPIVGEDAHTKANVDESNESLLEGKDAAYKPEDAEAKAEENENSAADDNEDVTAEDNEDVTAEDNEDITAEGNEDIRAEDNEATAEGKFDRGLAAGNEEEVFEEAESKEPPKSEDEQPDTQAAKSKLMSGRGRKGGKRSGVNHEAMTERGRKGGRGAGKNSGNKDHETMVERGRKGGKASGKARASHTEENKVKKQRVGTLSDDE
ncbi:zf-PARP-domain-containing protein [Nadsonia fulvescens var. elongata DSM 6958]|uniref:Zf-PARP-domain-containing protein n=1 Tax=Nadsonia fulvescens var. elongata DSM 6958 TaxID=857566 RepID=A0A1E3PJJ1_9ASCO|nr:zf-PARP-domain-containing protein [Nadsonia fulvescens var. elongata DSM 6958]